MEGNPVVQNIINQGVTVGMKVLGAIVIWIVGTWVIGIAVRLVKRGLASRGLDTTMLGYMGSAVSVILKVILVIAIFGYFGVETTSIAALLAGIGLAVGTMWGGMLANLAAGAFIVFLRPFKAGDFIDAGV